MVNNEDTQIASGAGYTSDELDALYDAGYFYGKTSGYPAEGYGRGHPDWKPWLDLVHQIVPQGRLLDLGCAFGYLVREASARGFRACGFDISSYGLAQEPELRSVLVRADLAALPLKDDSGDIVCLFDVLEHLVDPLAALDEAVRVLTPNGLLIGATPDPIFFDGEEQTHVYERPPSFWLCALQERGLEVRFRFSVRPFNFQFVAAPRGSSTAARLSVFQHDFFSRQMDFLEVDGSLSVVPRTGWGPLQEGCRRIAGSTASLYLLNSSSRPQQCKVDLEVRHDGSFQTLRIRLGSLVWAEVNLTSEQTRAQVSLPPLLLPSGGSHLVLENLTPEPGDIRVGPLSFVSREADSQQLTETLPFDLYQRYRLAAQLVEILKPESVLDIGGYLGDDAGHLATTADFLSAGAKAPEAVQTSDLRQGDFPNHTPALAWNQPFPEASFDLVMSLDLLEHLPQERRREFLAELVRLARHWIILGAPLDSAEVQAAEQALAETLMQDRSFLQEHRQLGLPSEKEIGSFFADAGFHTLVYRNGYLPRWTAMQALTQHFFSLNNATIFQALNRLYNRRCYRFDNRPPSYRTIFLLSRQPLGSSIEKLTQLEREQPASSLEELLLGQPEYLQLEQEALRFQQDRIRHWRDTQFLINERQKLIRLQSNEIATLRQELESTPLWRLAHRRWKQKGGK